MVQLTNTKLKKIVNVYQLRCVNGVSFGFGDFIRGCIFLHQVASLLNIEFDLDISNHPMSKYIEFNEKKCCLEIDYNNIYLMFINQYPPDSINRIIELFNTLNTQVYGILSNSFPINENYSSSCLNFIKSKLRPNKIMNDYIDETLNTLGLSKYKYGVIHIRTGDDNLVESKGLSVNFIKKVRNILLKKSNRNKKYLIISDSNTLKRFLKDIPNFYTIVKEIQHLGGQRLKSEESEGIKNTLLDFYLMEYSNVVISLSIYSHGSGFSKWCSVLNNIPYLCFKINE
jgi:hypothetical protein